MSDIDDLVFRIRQAEIDKSHDFADLTDDALDALDELTDRAKAAEGRVEELEAVLNRTVEFLREARRVEAYASRRLFQQTADVPSGHGNTAD